MSFILSNPIYIKYLASLKRWDSVPSGQWKSKDGTVHQLDKMNKAHMSNIIRYLEKQYNEFLKYLYEYYLTSMEEQESLDLLLFLLNNKDPTKFLSNNCAKYCEVLLSLKSKKIVHPEY